MLLVRLSRYDILHHAKKHLRWNKMIKIVPYQDCYQDTFRAINEEWIKKYFVMEESDYYALENPQQNIIDKGGFIFVALLHEKAVGVCALIKMHQDDYDFELAKMAVLPSAQGNNIGFLLGQTALNKAKEVGAKKIYLESNTVLAPAINLYYKLGFKKIIGHTSPYKRCDIQMEYIL